MPSISSREALSLIADLSSHLHEYEKKPELFNEINRIVAELTNSERASLYLYDSDKNKLYTKSAIGLDFSLTVDLDEGIAGRVATSKQPMIVPNTEKEKEFDTKFNDITKYKSENMLTVPILDKKSNLKGVLQAINKNKGQYDDQDLDIMKILAKITATILEDIDLVNILEFKVYEKTKELEKVNKQLQSKVDEQIEVIRQKENLLYQQSKSAAMGELINMIAHQWRQPVSSISAIASKVLLLNDLGKNNDDSKEMQDIINHSIFISETIDNFRSFFKPSKEKEESGILEMIEKALEFTSYPLSKQIIHLHRDYNSNAIVNVYKNEILQVLINIIKNAIDQLSVCKEKDKYIYLRTKLENNSIIIEVEDNAGGILEENLEKVFEQYFTTKGKDGSGIGLYMSSLIIKDHHNGQLTASNSKNGAIFQIKLPI